MNSNNVSILVVCAYNLSTRGFRKDIVYEQLYCFRVASACFERNVRILLILSNDADVPKVIIL